MIIESYRKKLQQTKEARDVVRNLDIHDKPYIMMMLEGKIQDYEKRIESLTSIGADIQCDECQKWIKNEESDSMIVIDKTLFICADCGNVINKVLMANEAEEKWNLPTGTIKQDCRRGMLDEYIKKGLIRKAGKYWLIHELVGKLYYLKKKGNKDAE